MAFQLLPEKCFLKLATSSSDDGAVVPGLDGVGCCFLGLDLVVSLSRPSPFPCLDAFPCHLGPDPFVFPGF